MTELILICGWQSMFPDDLVGSCWDCGGRLIYRPYNSRTAKKICLACAARRKKRGLIPDDVLISDETRREAALIMGKPLR